MPDLNKLRELVFEGDNEACFIERERILGRIGAEMGVYNQPDKYALILSKLLEEVSVPINEQKNTWLDHIKEKCSKPFRFA